MNDTRPAGPGDRKGRARARRDVAAWVLLALAGGSSARAGEPSIQLSDPEKRVLIRQERTRFTVRPYDPPYELELPAERSAASYATPEAAVEAWIAASADGDREWLLETFSAERRESYRPTPHDGRFFDHLFRGRRLVLGHRLEVGDLTLVEIESFDRDSGERVLRHLLAMKRTEAGWRLGSLPMTPLFAALVVDFDLSDDRLVIDRGHALRTSRPR